MNVYELEPDERLISTVQYCGVLIVATSHRLFEMKAVLNFEEGITEFEIKPILIRSGKGDQDAKG